MSLGNLETIAHSLKTSPTKGLVTDEEDLEWRIKKLSTPFMILLYSFGPMDQHNLPSF